MDTIPTPRPPTYAETDWPLVVRAQAGDRNALAQLYAAHHPGIVAFLAHRLAPLHRAGDAEDLAHDVWVRALRHLPDLTYQGVSVAAWLYTVARNLVYDLGKSAAYRLRATVDVPDVDLVPPVDDTVTLAELGRHRPRRRRRPAGHPTRRHRTPVLPRPDHPRDGRRARRRRGRGQGPPVPGRPRSRPGPRTRRPAISQARPSHRPGPFARKEQ